MSTDTRDGIAPSILRSTVKQLFFGLLPDHKSSQITEAIASGCGYGSNAAYMADAKDDANCILLPVSRIDRETMAKRLSALAGTPVDIDKIMVSTAIELVSRTLPGNVIPVGANSTVLRDGDRPYGTLSRQATAIDSTKASRLDIRLPDGTPFPYRLGQGNPEGAIDLVYGPPGKGKSLFVYESLLAITEETSKLPFISIVNVGRNASGLTAALAQSLPKEQEEVCAIRLSMSKDDAINPFDTPLGWRRPTPIDRAALVNLLGLLGSGKSGDLGNGLLDVIGFCVDAVYDAFSDRAKGSNPKRYVSYVDKSVDEAIAHYGIKATPMTTWWEITDKLFAAGDIRGATLAQRHAVPLTVDIITAMESQRATDIFGSARDTDGDSLVNATRNRITLALEDYPILWEPTRVDTWGARVLAIDVEYASPRGPGLAERHSVLSYMLARNLVSRDLYMNRELLQIRENGSSPFPDAYREHHVTRIRMIEDTPRYLVYDGYHRTYGTEAARLQTLIDIREGRKNGIKVIIISPHMDDFDELAVDMATGLWVFGAGTPSAAKSIDKLFRLSNDSGTAILNDLAGPGPEGKQILAKLSRYPGGNFEGVINFRSTPSHIWELTGDDADVKLREFLAEFIGRDKALDRLARNFPEGTARMEIGRRIKLDTPGGNVPSVIEVIREIVAELAAN